MEALKRWDHFGDLGVRCNDTVRRRAIWRLMNNELERMLKETAVA
jgi:hypothetical protein